MNTAILSGTNTFSGIGFAIPSNTIAKIVPTLIEKGYYPHPYLGLRDGTLTSDLAVDSGIPVNLKGAYVDSLIKNGPADKAGIHGSTTDQYSKKHLGDVIIAADGYNITTSDELVNYIGQHKSVGDNITLTVYRNGHAIDLKTTLAARLSLLRFLTAVQDQPHLHSQSPILQCDLRQYLHPIHNFTVQPKYPLFVIGEDMIVQWPIINTPFNDPLTQHP